MYDYVRYVRHPLYGDMSEFVRIYPVSVTYVTDQLSGLPYSAPLYQDMSVFIRI